MATSGLVTILFTDLVGSTELTSRIGDVAADELRRLHFEDLREALSATGGTEIKTIGDAVMASYSGAADAINGAVEMQRAVHSRNQRAAGQDLKMRVGVSAGDATFEDGDWFGTPVIEASRLCAEANGDQILISDLVKALAGSRVDHSVNSLGSRQLKGMADSLNVSEVEWFGEVTDNAVALPGFVDTSPAFAFAGRSHEYEVVRTAWKEAVEGERKVVLISGEPGIGKTRLVTEFVRTAHDQGGLVLWGRCDEELDVPYQPFAEALGQFTASISDERVREELAPYGAELSKLVPDLAGRLPGISAAVVGDADAERHRLFESVADAFSTMSETDPLVLVLDDIHWADKPSLLLLRHLLRRPEPIRLLILGTYRDTDLDRSHPLADVLADLRRQTGVERLDLKGLDAGEVASFMELAAGHELEDPARELADVIHTETEGNPFFLGEMMRHLAESGYIVYRDGRWVSDFKIGEVGIPEGIREVVGRRLSNLSEAVNNSLTVAAVIGPEFDIATVEAAGGPTGDELFDALDEAVAAGVIREVKGVLGRYAFGHALVRSTLYEELSTNRRVRTHWKVGQALEARYSDAPEHLDQLAHHFGEGALAGDPLIAVDYCRRAAERASADLAFEAATRSYERAIGAFELIDAPDLAIRCDIEIALAESLRDAGSASPRAAGFAAAQTARSVGDGERLARAALAMGLGGATTRVGNIDEELVLLLREALEEIGPEASRLRAALLAMLSMELIWGPFGEERVAVARQALTTAREIADAEVLSSVLAGMWALVDGSAPFIDELHGFCAEALELASPGSVTQMYAERGLLAFNAANGDTDAALVHLAQFTELAAESRMSHMVWLSMNDSAMMAAVLGDLEEAESAAGEALGYAQRTGVAEDSATGAYGGLLYALRRAQGRVGELIPVIESLIESQPGLPVWRVALSGALSLARRPDEAREHFMWLAADECARVPFDVEYPVTMCGLGRIAGEVDVPLDVFEPVYEALLPFAGTMNFTGSSIGDPNDLGLAALAGRLGRFDAADEHYESAIELCLNARVVPYELHSRSDWARDLERRGEVDRAREQASMVVAKAEGRGMDGPDGYVARSLELLERTS